jgi:hypothetical protein
MLSAASARRTSAYAASRTDAGTRPTAGKGVGLTALGGAAGAAAKPQPAAAAANEKPGSHLAHRHIARRR